MTRPLSLAPRTSGVCPAAAAHWAGRWPVLLGVVLLIGTLACNDLSGLAGSQALPSGTVDPNAFHTAAGALGLYQTTLAAFQGQGTQNTNQQGAFVDEVLTSGLLTDELQMGNVGEIISEFNQDVDGNEIDARTLPEGKGYFSDAVYFELQGVRNDAIIGIGALAAYDSSASRALRGQLYALDGYTELLLADLYCSGIPLSTIDFTGDFTYRAGSTTTQIYRDAIEKFDTALTLSGDSARILDLARVGKGRAWLDLGQYDSAAVAVRSVPSTFEYKFLVQWNNSSYQRTVLNNRINNSGQGVTVTNNKGGTGLPYGSSGDPRTASAIAKYNAFGVPLYNPLKYGGAQPNVSPMTVADGIEARLIQAEAAWHGVATGQGSWLDQLNALRATAITPALPPLNNPGTATAQVDLLFQERAYWLFVTGHRQSDLRRLIRQYGRDPNTVYPTGSYEPGSQWQTYGTNVNVPIPSAESVNPLFTGCLSRGA